MTSSFTKITIFILLFHLHSNIAIETNMRDRSSVHWDGSLPSKYDYIVLVDVMVGSYLDRNDLVGADEPVVTYDLNRHQMASEKVRGNTSTVNTEMYVHGNLLGFDLWVQHADDSWKYVNVLPYFNQVETSSWYARSPDHHGNARFKFLLRKWISIVTNESAVWLSRISKHVKYLQHFLRKKLSFPRATYDHLSSFYHQVYR